MELSVSDDLEQKVLFNKTTKKKIGSRPYETDHHMYLQLLQTEVMQCHFILVVNNRPALSPTDIYNLSGQLQTEGTHIKYSFYYSVTQVWVQTDLHLAKYHFFGET